MHNCNSFPFVNSVCNVTYQCRFDLYCGQAGIFQTNHTVIYKLDSLRCKVTNSSKLVYFLRPALGSYPQQMSDHPRNE